jgi:sulfur carrier protein ThiS
MQRDVNPAFDPIRVVKEKFVSGGVDPSQSLKLLPIPANKKYIVIIEDEKVSREDYADIIIDSDDEIVLLPPIKGG